MARTRKPRTTIDHDQRLEEVAASVLNALEVGTFADGLAMSFLLPPDYEYPGRHRSPLNRHLTALHGHLDTRGRRQWKEAGRRLKRGARGVPIILPKLYTTTLDADDPETGGQAGDRVQRCGGFLVRKTVFGYSDTEGTPIPELEEQLRTLDALPLIDVARDWGIEVSVYTRRNLRGSSMLGFYSHSGEVAEGYRRIALSTDHPRVWAHELIHAADHRLGQFTDSKDDREVVADLGAAVLLSALGCDTTGLLGAVHSYLSGVTGGPTAMLQACSRLLDRTLCCVDYLTAEAKRLADAPADHVGGADPKPLGQTTLF